MKQSWKLGELAGIGVYVHWTFLILPVVIGLSTFSSSGALAAAQAVLFVLALFGCVVLHELGHALAARRFGIATRDITLLPIGGVARLERMPRHPGKELAIALAGPAVNVAIAAALFIGLQAYFGAGALLSSSLLNGSILVRLMWANVVLVVFNLLPAFPMDGGRVLRALLAWRLPYARATHIAARVGQFVAILLAVVGLFGNLMLVFVALFVLFAGRTEAAMAKQEDGESGVRFGEVVHRQFQKVYTDSRVADVARQLLFASRRDFPVLQGRQQVGIVTAGDILSAMANGQGDRRVVDVMHRRAPTLAN